MTDRELMQQALGALELAKNSHGVLLMSDPPQDPWKTRRVDSALTQSITALRERLAQSEHDWEAEYINQVELHNQTLDELRDSLARGEK